MVFRMGSQLASEATQSGLAVRVLAVVFGCKIRRCSFRVRHLAVDRRDDALQAFCERAWGAAIRVMQFSALNLARVGHRNGSPPNRFDSLLERFPAAAGPR